MNICRGKFSQVFAEIDPRIGFFVSLVGICITGWLTKAILTGIPSTVAWEGNPLARWIINELGWIVFAIIRPMTLLFVYGFLCNYRRIAIWVTVNKPSLETLFPIHEADHYIWILAVVIWIDVIWDFIAFFALGFDLVDGFTVSPYFSISLVTITVVCYVTAGFAHSDG